MITKTKKPENNNNHHNKKVWEQSADLYKVYYEQALSQESKSLRVQTWTSWNAAIFSYHWPDRFFPLYIKHQNKGEDREEKWTSSLTWAKNMNPSPYESEDGEDGGLKINPTSSQVKTKKRICLHT